MEGDKYGESIFNIGAELPILPLLHYNLGSLAVYPEMYVQPADGNTGGRGTARVGRKQIIFEGTWKEYANCLGVDPDLFFPERGASTREAKEVCRGCVVREDCLEFALVNGEKFGIWGGMSERERRRIRRQRAVDRQRQQSSSSQAK